MPRGLQKTEQALAGARNRAVLPVLALALQSASSAVRAAAIRATIRRHDRESHTQLIRLFDKLGDEDRRVLNDAHRAMPHHAASALKDALLTGDSTLVGNACDIFLMCSDYDLFPTLVRCLEKPSYVHSARVSEAVSRFSVSLHDSLVAWSNGDRGATDPSFARHHLLSSLERSLNHGQGRLAPALVDAFLLLAPSDNEQLLEMLRDTSHSCHSQLTTDLATNTKSAALERLVALVRDIEAPQAALEAIAQRTDRSFIEYFLRELRRPVPLRVLHNMKRLRSVAWLENEPKVLLELDGRAQANAVDLAMATEMRRDALFGFLKLILQHGLMEGRRASCQALAEFSRPEANEVHVAAVHDPDAGVQAASLRQLLSRRIPDALQTLVSNLDSTAGEVRDAARSSLAEFNFVRYRAMFDLLDEHAARTTGVLVRQVDHSVRNKLVEDLMSPSVSTRIRGIEMVIAMGAASDVREPLITLARHENASVRKEAVSALAFATGPEVVNTLEQATKDSNRSVADAARQSLSRHASERNAYVANTDADRA
jgi:HEAT repeat protein